MYLKKDSVILFQGDSVTDCGRTSIQDENLGNGYPMFIASALNALYPENNYTFINRGISGNRTCDLIKRWDNDCLKINPDYISILIGINDCWRRYDSNDPTSTQKFKANYVTLLKGIKENTSSKIIMMEPFVLPVQDNQNQWREDLDPKINVVRDLAREYADIFIPLDGIFSQASVVKNCTFWTADGVHPNLNGHALITKEWLKAIKAY